MNYRADTDREEAAVLVEAFLERDLLSESVTEEVSRHHAAGNHPEALELILETRRNRRSS